MLYERIDCRLKLQYQQQSKKDRKTMKRICAQFHKHARLPLFESVELKY